MGEIPGGSVDYVLFRREKTGLIIAFIIAIGNLLFGTSD